MKGDVKRKNKTAQARQAEYTELTTDGKAPAGFRAWLRGRFGLTVAQRHDGAKPSDAKVGAPNTRVQHRQGGMTRKRA